MDTCEIGRFGEDIAAAYLEARGYEVVDRNVRACGGEVDLVATVGAGGAAGGAAGDGPRDVVFVEVKYRTSDAMGVGAEAVTATKLRTVSRVGGAWLAAHPEIRPRAVRIDVIDITGGEVTHYRDVTR
ncbi:YraN family protein [Corynebacterium bovis]|uniref:YraN family protein n=1 Tax=Corynebacterium bovis TaxID=36808 RepID=UPI002447E3BF|nr:YraN family protein [Corynebacterium bovis]MDH2455182.1 YraN family protein [Corynebacterium bovis]